MIDLYEIQKIAQHFHSSQKDLSGQPYILHVERVARNVNLETGCFHTTAVALLHDILEDTSCTHDYLKSIVPQDVYEAVVLLTRTDNISYDDYIEKIAQNDMARIVKINDLKDNMDLSRLKKVQERDLRRNEKYKKSLVYLESFRTL